MAFTDGRQIDGVRLWQSLMEMAEIGATPRGGVCRIALSQEDGVARARFRAMCQAAGLAVRVDAVGNMFARREGSDPSRPPVLFGSHLDTQPSGGRFDGVLGVLAGLEVMRSLDALGLRTVAPLELVNWTDEEGCRFGLGLIGSGVWAGVHNATSVERLTDASGVSFGAALDAIGARGEAPAAAFPADAYFELHIEQGPVLERAGLDIGVVTGGQAQIWFDVVAEGQAAHAGTTPPEMRRDALVCAAQVIALVDRMMRARGAEGRGTVGQLAVHPNSRNVIPGAVRFSVEFRHPSTAEIDVIATEFNDAAQAIAREAGVTLTVTPVLRIAAQEFDPSCIALVADAAAAAGYAAQTIISGAGHDALYVARHVPTAMIFVPCAGGLSHNEAESMTPEQAAAGTQVLFDIVRARADRPISAAQRPTSLAATADQQRAGFRAGTGFS